jgi:hypothetical protein
VIFLNSLPGCHGFLRHAALTACQCGFVLRFLATFLPRRQRLSAA